MSIAHQLSFTAVAAILKKYSGSMKGIVPILYFIYSNRIYIIYFERRKVREWFQKYKYTELDFFLFVVKT